MDSNEYKLDPRYSVDAGSRFLTGCETGDSLTVLDCLYQDVDINIKDSDGIPGLIHAIKNNHIEIVDILLEMGEVDVNSVDKDGDCPLSHATCAGKLQICERLLKHPSINPNLGESEK